MGDGLARQSEVAVGELGDSADMVHAVDEWANLRMILSRKIFYVAKFDSPSSW